MDDTTEPTTTGDGPPHQDQEAHHESDEAELSPRDRGAHEEKIGRDANFRPGERDGDNEEQEDSRT